MLPLDELAVMLDIDSDNPEDEADLDVLADLVCRRVLRAAVMADLGRRT